MSEILQRFVSFERLHNFRDFGGYPAADGQLVRRNQLYRFDSLGKVADADAQQFAALGVRTVIDLRYPWEADAGGRVPAGLGVTGLATQRLVADWHAFYPDRPLLWPHYGKAPAAAMQVFLTELAQRHGSVRGYVADYLGAPDAVVSDLRTRYLTSEATAAG